jgi:hypothetical protein
MNLQNRFAPIAVVLILAAITGGCATSITARIGDAFSPFFP